MAGKSRARVIRARAFAKINLSLRVLGLRPDGYHELRTVFQSLALHDTLAFRAAEGAFRISCNEAACPTDATNLVWQAAERVWEAAGRGGAPRDVTVHIVKRIPLGAGLGGGSSDAAAAVRGLAAWWRAKLTPVRLREIAASLGADVPYFLEGGTVLGVERGDVLFPLQDAVPAWVVLVIPPFAVATKDAYGWFDRTVGAQHTIAGACGSRRSLAGASRAPRGTRPHRRALEPLLLPEISNDLQRPVAARHPEIARLVEALGRRGASLAAMSGSGSAVFGLFARPDEARAAARHLAGRGGRVIVTRTIDRRRYRVKRWL